LLGWAAVVLGVLFVAGAVAVFASHNAVVGHSIPVNPGQGPPPP
jgi:hypothetical protein